MVNSVGKRYSEVERAYLAGLFDGDGALMACIEFHREKRYKFRVRLVIKITQKNKVFLEKLAHSLGYGKVRVNRRVFEFDIKAQQDVLTFINLIHPYCQIKKEQLTIGLEILNTKVNSQSDLLKISRLADALSGLNVRSLGRRKNYTAKIQEYFSSND